MISSLSITLSTVCVGVFLLVHSSSAYDPEPKWDFIAQPLKLDNETECERLWTILRDSIGQFLEKRKFNGIDDFLEFHDSYKRYMVKKSSNTVSGFYAYFTPIIQNCETYAYIVDDLITHILTTSPILKDPSFKDIVGSIYRVSVDRLTTKTLLESLDDGWTQPKTTKMFDVMACIKLSINQKIAYILMDPSHGSPDPILILYTTKLAGNSIREITEFVNNKVEYNTMSKDQNYVYTFYFDNTGTPNPALVYAASRFRSLTEFTQKPSLLEKFRAIIKRDKSGKIIASVQFNAVPAVQKVQGRDTCVAKFIVSWNGNSIRIPFTNLKVGKGKLQQSIGAEEFKSIQGAAEAMKLKIDQLVKKLKEAGRAMENFQFLRDIQKLDEQLDDSKKLDAILKDSKQYHLSDEEKLLQNKAPQSNERISFFRNRKS